MTVLDDDDFEVRIFTLADWAALTNDGKLCLGGAGVTQVFLQDVPGALPPLHVVARVAVPYRRTLEQIPFSIQLLDADRHTVGPDIASGKVESGIPAGVRPGDEFAFQLLLAIAGYPIPREGTFYFHLSVDGKPLSRLPVKISKRPQTA